jgi:opacity protein-like surface antigen
MRATAVLGLAGLLFANEAMAADYLRGSAYEGPVESYNWAGVYVGGQVGYTGADFDFGDSAKSQVANMVRSTTIESEAHISDLLKLPVKSSSGTSYGGFIGYNAQWGDAVVGIEGNYNHMDIKASSLDAIGRSFTTSDGYFNNVNLGAGATARVTDYGTLRFRAGYAAGYFMPYMMAGVAVGSIDYTRYANINMQSTDPNGVMPPLALVQSTSESKNGAIAFGYMLGAGIDVGLLPNLFLRGEYEWTQFAPVGGITIQMNTFRTALALKF